MPVGNYEHSEAQLVAFTNQGAPISARMRLTVRRLFRRLARRDGAAVPIQDQRRVQYRDHLDPQRRRPAAAARSSTNLVSSRVSYSFSPRVYVQALLQYNDRADLWSSNVRFGWLNQANTGLFVVYNDTQGLDDSTLLRPDRSLTIKFSRLVDLLN